MCRSVSLSEQLGAVTALLSVPIDSSYNQDGDLDVTQTDVILDNDDLIDLDVDFSYAEDDESDSESAASFSDSWCFPRTGNECKPDKKKSVLPSIKSAIQSSVDFMLTSDSEGKHRMLTRNRYKPNSVRYGIFKLRISLLLVVDPFEM